jgi:O-acetyl-ADP-ribose deacetylase (regulator of RNase III)
MQADPTQAGAYERIEPALGDITREQVDAIVNAANSELPEIMAECRKIGHCAPGEAVITGAGKLQARFVIHAVGPIWQGGGADEELLLASCHERALELAREHGCRTVAFPAISTGAYGYPARLAAPIALAATNDALVRLPLIEKVRFVFVDEKLLGVYEQALARLKRNA